MSPHGRVVVRSSEDKGGITEWIKQETDGLGPDAMYDCLGVGGDATLTSQYVDSIKSGGRVALVAGGAFGKMELDAEVDELIALVAAGVIDLSYLRHKCFSLDQVNDAFEYVGDRPGGAVNVVAQPQTSPSCVLGS
ncbi:hypothetical protein LTR64_008433 [Lithohypha guttulata]|uniref:uncharacterized protein n=1 Tax=Lithohypha guttulata TaxID=1690604 RepID=UPI002DDEA1A0|nr:hypothetical protein LTR51_008522 [Lithohypha guttulata]